MTVGNLQCVYTQVSLPVSLMYKWKQKRLELYCGLGVIFLKYVRSLCSNKYEKIPINKETLKLWE